ncbi:MAG: cyclic pyranopterin monophosphate synthase MoaC, partial [Chloroflexi bacterium]|nr:cyclic pyranopterin monophosphate synthase MoaC [Chloroflexota bacterium]
MSPSKPIRPSEEPEQPLTHLDADGTARMVDIGQKPDSRRTAVAGGRVVMKPATLAAIESGNLAKGDVLTVARLAGIMAAKRTAELIPLCHPLALTHIEVDFTMDKATPAISIYTVAQTTGKTGVEMEALTATSVAALTIYDMAKAIDREMRIEGIRLLEKSGGQSGHF